MSQTQKVSRLVVDLNTAIPVGTDYIVILRALNRLQERILERLDEKLKVCPNCNGIIPGCTCEGEVSD